MDNALVLITHVVNDAVIHGFIPDLLNQINQHASQPSASVIVVTDHKDAHIEALAELTEHSKAEPLYKSSLAGSHTNSLMAIPDICFLECDVFNPLAIIDSLNNHRAKPSLVISNSDHLQAASAIVSHYYGLASKDWRQCLRFKDKYLTREQLAQLPLADVDVDVYHPEYQLLCSDSFTGTDGFTGTDSKDSFPIIPSFPVVAKPKHGVASMHVQRCDNKQELTRFVQDFWQQSPTTPILIESFVEGTLITLETLGDGERLIAVGGFEVHLTPPPYFVELGAVWNSALCIEYQDACLSILRRIGVGLGVCHSEFIVTSSGELHLVEVNYRSIGDGREFLLDKMAPYPWFTVISQLHQGTSIDQLIKEYGSLSIESYARIHYVTATQSGTVQAIPDAFERRNPDSIVIHQPLKQCEQPIRLTHSNKDYLSRLLVVASSGNAADALIDRTLTELHWQVA